MQRISHVHHSYSELIMGHRVECLHEVHKAHIEWLLVLAYESLFGLLSPLLVEIPPVRHSDPFLQYDPKKDLACV